VSLDPLTVLANNVPENPDHAAYQSDTNELIQTGVVVVPWSGGLDSTTAAMWAIETGMKVVLLSCTSGQPWDAGERRARHFIRQEIIELRGLSQVERRLKEAPATYGHIQAGRNFDIGIAAWDVANAEGMWGEIWMAWVDGEIPIATGDKSRAALTHLQSELGGPFRFVVPTARFTKGALVRWWMDHGLLYKAAKLYSCFVGGPQPCGTCQACFRFWMAFAANRAEGALAWGGWIDFDEHLEKYENKQHSSFARSREEADAIQRYKERE
jgi:7-cyano-7-deazaguanine synthase in queuosine biosynthesis